MHAHTNWHRFGHAGSLPWRACLPYIHSKGNSPVTLCDQSKILRRANCVCKWSLGIDERCNAAVLGGFADPDTFILHVRQQLHTTAFKCCKRLNVLPPLAPHMVSVHPPLDRMHDPSNRCPRISRLQCPPFYVSLFFIEDTFVMSQQYMCSALADGFHQAGSNSFFA
jgi:hypothetical protein